MRMVEHECIEIQAYAGSSEPIDDLVTFPVKELEKMKIQSIAAENNMFEDIHKLVRAWEIQAKKTKAYEAAIQYIELPKVSHTSNQWEQMENNWFERSNKVYRMRYRVKKRQERSPKASLTSPAG